jgi:hypothetical protein
MEWIFPLGLRIHESREKQVPLKLEKSQVIVE